MLPWKSPLWSRTHKDFVNTTLFLLKIQATYNFTIMIRIINSTQESDKREDFFYAISENNWSKLFSLAFSIMSLPVILLLLYTIIWYEKYGADKKRTILNQLVSSICWTMIAVNACIQVPRFLRYFTGRYCKCSWDYFYKTLRSKILYTQ